MSDTATQAAGTEAPGTPAAGAVSTPAAGTTSTILTAPSGTPAGEAKGAEGTTGAAQTKEGTQEGKQAEAGAGDKAKAESTPAEIELKLPEGVQADAVPVDSIKALAKDLGLKGEAAQKVLEFHLATAKAEAEKRSASWEAAQKQWVEALKSDKEFGGKAFEANQRVAQKAIEKYGSPALKQFLNDSGLGSHPELVAFAYRAGKALAEDSVAGTSAGSSARPTQADELRLQYPSMFKD